MILQEHAVQHYRNIEQASFRPGPHLTVICGKNGQGKTNLLESVWLLCGAKSFRGGKDVHLVQRGQPYAVLEATAKQDSGEEDQFRLVIGGEGCEEAGVKPGRTAKLNGADFGRATNLAGHFYAVVFSPAHLDLVKGSPEGRRRFVDAALCQLYPGYLAVLRRYTRAVAQKNALLRDARRFAGVDELIAPFDEEMARAGFEIIARRTAYLAQLFAEASAVYDSISAGSEPCAFTYLPTAADEETLRHMVRAARAADLHAGCCTVGPHREDIAITVAGQDARAFASQGQQRSAALALKLAEAGLIRQVTGTEPVMLLDDVLSELDAVRRDFLLRKIEGRQVLLTSCDAAAFHDTPGAIYEMEAGRLRAVKHED